MPTANLTKEQLDQLLQRLGTQGAFTDDGSGGAWTRMGGGVSANPMTGESSPVSDFLEHSDVFGAPVGSGFETFDEAGNYLGSGVAEKDDTTFGSFLQKLALVVGATMGAGALGAGGLGGAGASSFLPGGAAMDTAGFEGLTGVEGAGAGTGFLEGSSAGMVAPAASAGAFTSAVGGGGVAGAAGAGGLSLLGSGGIIPAVGSLVSGAMSLESARKAGNVAGDVAKAMDPFGPYRAGYAQKLQDLEKSHDVSSIPGYQAGLEGVERTMAAQGYTGSGNMMKALQDYGGNFYNAELQRLAGLAGANATPGAGAKTAADLTGAGLGSEGYGASQLISGLTNILSRLGGGNSGGAPTQTGVGNPFV